MNGECGGSVTADAADDKAEVTDGGRSVGERIKLKRSSTATAVIVWCLVDSVTRGINPSHALTAVSVQCLISPMIRLHSQLTGRS